MLDANDQICPCSSGTKYADCCQIFLKGSTAVTAEQLMRSRYTAYTLADAEYLYKTSHNTIKSGFNKHDIITWSKENTWQKLEVIDTKNGGIYDTQGIVGFKAYFADSQGVSQVLHEISTFEKIDGHWYYKSGIHPDNIQKVSRNSPCPCGSGKKYKRCCI